MNADDELCIGIFGINYAPEPTGIAPYTSRMAAGLRDRGHDVKVVTAFPHYPEWRVPDSYAGWTVDEVVDGIPVRRVRHYVPARPSAVARVLSELSFGVRVTGVRPSEFDVLICPSPALLSTAAVALRMRVTRGTALGVIVQDLYSAGIGETDSGSRRAARVLTKIEAWTLRQADGVSVIHDRFKRRVVDSLDVDPNRIDVIRNWTHLDAAPVFDRSAFRTSMGWSKVETVVLHTGAMGDKQGLGNVVEAARIAAGRQLPVKFVLIGNGKQRSQLEAAADGCPSIEFRDPLPGNDFVKALHSADLLLVNEKPGVQEMAVPSKLTSYFSSGVAVLAATETGSTTADELRSSQAGMRVDPGRPEELVTAVLRLREDSTLRVEMGARGPAYCERLLSERVALDAYDAWVRKLYRRKHGEHA